jgi:CRP-like cAMP-binding protein
MERITKSDFDRELDLLRQVKLFDGVDESILSSLLYSGGIEMIKYAAGEAIFSPSDKSKKAIIFLSGTAEAYTADEGRSLLLRTFTGGNVVGISNLFSQDDFASRVIAVKKCEVLEISAENFGKILESDKRAMYNFVVFLSGKIRYLNRKIVTLTAGSAERRLAYFLDTSIPEGKTDAAEITIQMNSLCEMLNLGRASLYRAADRLTEEGFIKRDGKTIVVLDRSGMMEKYK